MTGVKPFGPGDVVGDSLAYLAEPLNGLTITGKEAVQLASVWWEKIGRKLIDRAFNRSREDKFKGAGANGAPAIRIKGTEEVVIPSRILEGKPWDELDRRERALVVKSWLSQYRHLYLKGKVNLQ